MKQSWTPRLVRVKIMKWHLANEVRVMQTD